MVESRALSWTRLWQCCWAPMVAMVAAAPVGWWGLTLPAAGCRSGKLSISSRGPSLLQRWCRCPAAGTACSSHRRQLAWRGACCRHSATRRRAMRWGCWWGRWGSSLLPNARPCMHAHIAFVHACILACSRPMPGALRTVWAVRPRVTAVGRRDRGAGPVFQAAGSAALHAAGRGVARVTRAAPRRSALQRPRR